MKPAIPLLLILLFGSGCGGVFFRPDAKLYFPPEHYSLSPETFYLTTADGVRLHSWLFAATTKPRRGTIVQFHGNAQNVSSHYTSLVWLIEAGYDLFTFDYRGYGVSEGKPSAAGVITDGRAALHAASDLHHKRGGGQFVVYGQSLGGLVAARSWYEFPERSRVEADALLVLDSTFSSYRDLAQAKLASFWLTWLISPLGRVLVSDRFASHEILRDIRVPTLVIHDERDPVVPARYGRAVYEALSPSLPKDFWGDNRGGHIAYFAPNHTVHQRQFVAYLEARRRSAAEPLPKSRQR